MNTPVVDTPPTDTPPTANPLASSPPEAGPAEPSVPPEPDPPAPPVAAPPGGLGLADLESMVAAVKQATHAGCADRPSAMVIDEIGALEKLQHALAACQADRIRAFARTYADTRAAREGDNLDVRKVEQDVVGQVALACGVSPTVARTKLRMARNLRDGLDHVHQQYAAGELSWAKTRAVVSGTADLDAEQRARVDAELSGRDLGKLGVGRIRSLVASLAATVAPATVKKRAAKARADRRVTLRAGEHGMCWLTAHLPIEQGAMVMAALADAVKKHFADPVATVIRGKGAITADTLVERVTGREIAENVDVEIQAIVPVEALLDPDCELPATIPGLGQVPIEHLLSSKTGRKTLRRLVTHEGIVIGGDSRARRFTGVLSTLIRARDGQRCREPYCDAPVRHIDHIQRSADGGVTEFDAGRGTCEFHNYVRENPGWSVRATEGGIETITPTGHTYVSPTPRAA